MPLHDASLGFFRRSQATTIEIAAGFPHFVSRLFVALLLHFRAKQTTEFIHQQTYREEWCPITTKKKENKV
jgi:hypothetical protein